MTGIAGRRALRPVLAIALGLVLASTTVIGSPQEAAASKSTWSTPVPITASGSEVYRVNAPVVLTDGRILTATVENRLVGALYRYFIVAYLTAPDGVTTESILAGPGDADTFSVAGLVAGPNSTAALAWRTKTEAFGRGEVSLVSYQDSKWQHGDQLGSPFFFWLQQTPMGIRAQSWRYDSSSAVWDPPAVVSFLAPDAQGRWETLAERTFPRQNGQFVEPVEVMLDSGSALGLGFGSPVISTASNETSIGLRSTRMLEGRWVVAESPVATQSGLDFQFGGFLGDLDRAMTTSWSFSDGRTRSTRTAVRLSGAWTLVDLPAAFCEGLAAMRWEVDAPHGPLVRCLSYNPSSRATTLQRVQFTDQGPVVSPDVPIPTLGRWTFCEVLRATNIESPDLCLLSWDASFVGMIGKDVPGGFEWIAAPDKTIAMYDLPGDTYAAIGSAYPFDQQRPTTSPVTYSRLESPSPTPPDPPQQLKVKASGGSSVRATWSPPGSVPGIQYEYRVRWGKQPFSPWKLTSKTSARLVKPGKPQSVTVQVRSVLDGLVSSRVSSSIRLR